MKLMTPHEKLTLIELLEQMPTTTPCNVCMNYDCGFCQLCHQKIPAEVLDEGCGDWKFNAKSPPF